LKKIGFIFFIVLAILSRLTALNPPELKGRVNDYAEILTASETDDLNRYLASIENSIGAQIAILIIPSLEGDNLEMFSYRTATQWQLGEEDKDNGLLLLVSMKEKQIRIEVGYGLEGDVTDSQAGYIIRNIITPQFKKGDFSQGISEGVHTLGDLILGDTTLTAEQMEETSSEELFPSILFVVFFIFIFGLRLLPLFGIGRRRRFFGSTLYSTNRSSRGFSSGGFSSGGGFSGGGGSFGGGGSSGGW
jgi:uncharacterized protein